MSIASRDKERIKNRIREALSGEKEIQKIVLFGSFVHSKNPGDIDIAVFQNSNESYIPLSMKYRRLIREISKSFPVDIIPLKMNSEGSFLEEINSGETIYER